MAKDVIITPLDGDIQFENASGTEAGKIEQSGDDLVISNAVGDVLIGDGTADVYVGDGTNNVDIIFEQNGSIKGEDGSSVNLTIGSYDTDLTISGSTLNLQPAGNTTIIGGPLTVTKVSSDQNTSQDSGTIPATTIAETIKIHGGSYTNGQYTTEIVKVDRSGNLPLYVRQSKGTANSFTNLIRIGDHGQTNGTDIFAVFGKARVDGQFTVTGGSIVLGGTGRIQGIDTVSSGTDAANKNYADTKLPKSGGTMTGDLIVTGSITSTGIIYTDEIRDRTGQDLTITAGEASGYLSQTTHNDEIIRLAAEGGVIVYSSTDNLTSGLNKATTLINSSGHMSIAGDLTVVGGDITLNGTGRIQGIDTVSVGTDAANKTYADKKLDKTGGTMSGVITSDGITSGTTAANRAFQVSTAVSGALHVKAADGGTTGNAHTAPLITVTGNGSTVQGGIYVSQNSSTGTSLGFFTTDSYATGPKLGLSILDTGAVHINRGNLVLEGTGRIQGIDTVSSGTDAANKDYVDNHDPSTNKLPLAGGTMTGAIDFHQSDSEDIIITGNASASNTNQFFLKHNFAKVDIGNLRGDINFTSGSVQFTNNIYVGEYIYHKGDTNTFIRLLGDELRIVAGGRNIIKMDEGTDPDKVVLGDSATETYTEGDFLIGTTSNEGLLTVRTDSGTTQFTTMRNNSGGFVNRTYADYNNDGTTVEYQERVGVDGNYTRIGNFSNHPLYLTNNNDTKVSILTSGNVGIGTTTTSAVLQLYKAQGTTEFLTLSNSTSAGNITIGFQQNDTDGMHHRAQITSEKDSNGTYGGRLDFKVREHSTANYETALTLRSDQSVGIGTTSPTAKLQVEGSGSTILDIQGSQGQLFSVTDDLSGDLFTVADISGVPILNVNASATSSFDGYLNVNGPRVHIENVGNDTTATLKLSGNNNTGTPGQQTSATIEHRGEHLKTVINHNGSDVITIGTGTDTTFAGNVMPAAENLYNIGSSSTRWEDLYVDDGYLRNAFIDQYIYHNGDTNTRIEFQGDKIFLRTGGTDRITMTNNGVGIGTATMHGALTVHGGHIRIDSSGGTDNYYLEMYEAGAQRFRIYENNDNVYFDGGPGATTFRPRQGGGTNNFQVSGASMMLTTSGQVIGNVGEVLYLYAGGTSGAGLEINEPANSIYLKSIDGIFPENDNESVIGDATYTFANGRFTNFHVDSTLTVRSYIDLADSDGIRFGSSDDFRMFYDGSNNEFEMEMESACNRIRITDNTTSRFQFAKDGTFTATGDVIAYSDERVKENIVTIGNALDKVSKLRGVTYNRTDIKDKSTKIGVIAQEIQKVLPEVIQKDEEGMLGVSYGNMVGLLIEGMKEQQQQIEELKAIVNKLQNEK